MVHNIFPHHVRVAHLSWQWGTLNFLRITTIYLSSLLTLLFLDKAAFSYLPYYKSKLYGEKRNRTLKGWRCLPPSQMRKPSAKNKSAAVFLFILHRLSCLSRLFSFVSSRWKAEVILNPVSACSTFIWPDPEWRHLALCVSGAFQWMKPPGIWIKWDLTVWNIFSYTIYLREIVSSSDHSLEINMLAPMPVWMIYSVSLSFYF